MDWQPRRDPSPAGEGGLAREREPGGVPGRVLPTPVGCADSALPSGFAGSRGGITAEPDEHCPDHLVVETEGVLAAWFDARGCRAALVRPDHYVFGVAVDDESLDTLVAELASRLALPTGSPHETARSTA